jgi:hypothetical protein
VKHAVETGLYPCGPGEPAIWHYKMAPGAALRLDDEARTAEPVEVSRAMAAKATDTNILKWIGGKTVVVFDLDGARYAQLLPEPAEEKRSLSVTRVKKPRKRVGLL